MFNDDDFPVLASIIGHGSQQTQKSTSSVNDDLKTTQERRPSLTDINESDGIRTNPDGLVTNIFPGMLNDQFGMAGLLTFLRTIDSSPSIVGLALGHDVTHLGLNLNTSKNLFQTFGGPWAEFPCRIQDLDAKVPSEYLTNSTIRNKLPNIKLNKLHEDVLFYLFYNCPGEVYQVAAASELYARDWRFHKIEGFWLQKTAFSAPPKETEGTYERCQYNVFDPILWKKVPKEMVLECKDLEGKPSVPGTNHQLKQQQHGQQYLQKQQPAPQQQPPSQQQQRPALTPKDSLSSAFEKTVDFLNNYGNGPNGCPYTTMDLMNQLKRVSHGSTISRPEMRLLLSVLHENPEFFACSDVSDMFLDFIQYEPEIAGILLAFQLMYRPSHYRSSIEILLNMNVDVSVLFAVNKFVQICENKNLKIPNDFLHKFISACILTCENGSSNGWATTDRLVRMICVFFNVLLDLRYFDVSTVRSEIQNFAISYLSLKEASQLYQKTLHNI